MANKGGRPSGLTKQVSDAYCDAISIGATKEMAAANAGVSYAVTRKWLRRGEEAIALAAKGEPVPRSERKYVKFVEVAEAARLEAGLRWVDVVNKAANFEPTWAMRMLQTNFPDDFKPLVQRAELTGRGGGPIETASVLVYVPDNGRGPDPDPSAPNGDG